MTNEDYKRDFLEVLDTSKSNSCIVCGKQLESDERQFLIAGIHGSFCSTECMMKKINSL